MIDLKPAFLKKTKEKHYIEDSIALRAVSTAIALTGVLAASQLTDAPIWLTAVSVVGCITGSIYSYWRRHKGNFIGKIWISLGILVATGFFFNELITLIHENVADARVPLTKLLMLLIALHCFDLPRRRDLSVSALVGVTLISSAATLSRDLFFSIYMAGFIFLTIIMFQLDCGSRSIERALNSGDLKTGEAGVSEGLRESLAKENNFKTATLLQSFSCFALILALSMLVFSMMPRMQVGFMKELRIAGNFPYQTELNMIASQFSALGAGSNSVRSSPDSYYGFAEELDTNYRGKLEDKLVLSISESYGTYMRGMAYDVYDGRSWRMSKPKETKPLNARGGHGFDIYQSQMSLARVASKPLSQVVYVESECSNLVFCANIPYQVYFPSQSLEMDEYGSIRSPAGVLKDQVYTVFSNVPVYVYSKMRTENIPNPNKNSKMQKRLANYLELPAKLSPRVAQLAERIAGKGNNFARAERISNYLQSHYEYDLDVPVTPKERDTVSDFLFYLHRGYCEHFASAMAIMCRTQEIPTRLVTGYAPGHYNPFTGLWEVKMTDAHSWVEVFVRGYGWVPFDPTPGSIMGRSLEEPQSVPAYLAQILAPYWKAFIQSPQIQSLGDIAVSLLGLLYKELVKIAPFYQAILAVASGLALALSLLFGPWKSAIRKIAGMTERDKSRQLDQKLAAREAAEAASRDFIRVESRLGLLGIKRQSFETADELLERSRKELCSDSQESRRLLETLANFVELYATVRFGGSSYQESQLKELSITLDKMTTSMAEQRKTDTLAKADC